LGVGQTVRNRYPEDYTERRKIMGIQYLHVCTACKKPFPDEINTPKSEALCPACTGAEKDMSAEALIPSPEKEEFDPILERLLHPKKEKKMPPTKEITCSVCKEKFDHTGYDSPKKCPGCRKPKTVPAAKMKPVQTLDKLDQEPEIRVLAEKLMKLSGVNKLQLTYDNFSVTIERS
jgi:DNA-directed RNA polymerase subunit RPC12/RpoP